MVWLPKAVGESRDFRTVMTARAHKARHRQNSFRVPFLTASTLQSPYRNSPKSHGQEPHATRARSHRSDERLIFSFPIPSIKHETLSVVLTTFHAEGSMSEVSSKLVQAVPQEALIVPRALHAHGTAATD
jgi:hypothetical protein